MAATTGRYGVMEMRHSKSEDLLGAITSGSRSPSPSVCLPTTASEDDLIATTALREGDNDIRRSPRAILRSSRAAGLPADRIDPEDSIRDIVTENDLYRSV